MKRMLLMIGLLASLFVQAQQVHVSGFVSDANDGERIIGANVFLQDHSKGCHALHFVRWIRRKVHRAEPCR